MPDIHVTYESMPRDAKLIRELGRDINSQIKNAYQNVSNLHESKAWYGKRYNKLVEEFNKIIPSINDLLALVVTNIPFTLETIANNYALADTGSKLTEALEEKHHSITPITVHDDEGFDILFSEVSNAKQNISDCFKTSLSKMDSIENIYSKISWTGQASEQFKLRFNNLKNEIVESFTTLEKHFTDSMNQTLEDMSHVENVNKSNSNNI